MSGRTATDADRRDLGFFGTGLDGGVMAILRGMDVATTLAAMDAAWDAGIGLIEIPVTSPQSLDVLERAVAHAAGRPLGAGTVLDAAMLRRVRDLGATFSVAPDLDVAVVSCAEALGMPHLPGVSTPGDVARAVRAGVHWLKAFPASVLTPAWITAMHGPFPQVSFVATGGIGPENAVEFITAGARAVSLGSSIATMRPRELERCVSSVRRALHE